MFERGNRGWIIAGLQANFAKIEKRLHQSWIAFRGLPEFLDGHVKLALLMRLNARLHVLSALRRNVLKRQPQK
jgi:hypothetical protein